jgi:hypothetical protein
MEEEEDKNIGVRERYSLTSKGSERMSEVPIFGEWVTLDGKSKDRILTADVVKSRNRALLCSVIQLLIGLFMYGYIYREKVIITSVKFSCFRAS